MEKYVCKNGHINPEKNSDGSCKICKTNYNLQYRTRINQAVRLRCKKNRLKCINHLGGKCIDCTNDNPDVLVFDHLFEKEKNIATILASSWETILIELNKCELVCENCHLKRTRDRIVTSEKQKIFRTHKKLVALNYLGDRCTDCTNDNPDVLVFDHIFEKEKNIGAILTQAFDTIKTELDKCEVVCANCHRIRTRNRDVHLNDQVFKNNREAFWGEKCKHGHDRTTDNTYIDKMGNRSCTICRKNKNKQRYNKDEKNTIR